ncbi:hypothetical protein RJ55_07322 [Drechmeria coniospora]|nr:hypothetical protein RJ55_07322 [Drechmeria coniospora]
MPSSAGLGRALLVACALHAPLHALAASAAFPPLLHATLNQLQRGLGDGTFTSVDLVEAYLARIREVNDELRAVVEINPDAVDIASRLDEDRRHGNGTCASGCPALHGVPILVKDNIATADAMNTTAGSHALVGATVASDSTVVAKLRRGAVVLGKANMSQWANMRGLNTTDGWSATGGQTVGAYYEKHYPYGSSSGSAVAVSVGLAWAALGTDSYGSIVAPAGRNNVVGIKPTVGLTSRHMVVPVSDRRDTVGPMARTVKDAAHLLTAIAGVDARDEATAAILPEALCDYARACVRTGLRGKRIGVPRHPSFVDGSDELKAFASALQVMRDEGAEIVDDLTLDAIDILQGDEHVNDNEMVMLADFGSNLPEYLSRLVRNPHNITSLQQLLTFTRNTPSERWPEHDTSYWDVILGHGLNKTNPAVDVLARNLTRIAGDLGLLGALAKHKLDALVFHTDNSFQIAGILGSPVVTVPLGATSEGFPVEVDEFSQLNMKGPNMPFGLSFAGAPWSEETLIGMAYAFERSTNVRKKVKPMKRCRPTTELEDVVGRRKAKQAAN